jgi:pimeloyl-ACP methyl ester carboxylesterase
VLFRDFSACNDFTDGPELVAAVRCPTLLILGREDRMTPHKAGLKLARCFDGAEVEVLDGCGHMMMVEAPERVAAALRKFL